MQQLNLWLGELPRGASRCLKASFLACVFILVGWGKHLVLTPPGAIINFADAAAAWLATAVVLLFGTLLPLIYACAYPVRSGRPRLALQVSSAALVPVILYLLISTILTEVKDIRFD